MAELKIIHGRQSIKYDHFEDLEFIGCRAIDTRLMGVTALKIKWGDKRGGRGVFYQIIHLDYSEYGIDEYREFDCVPGSSDFKDKKREMNELWDHFISVMGGGIKDIDPPVMMRLISDALPFAGEDIVREYDDEENKEFRNYALLRIGYMMDALRAAGHSEESCSESDAIKALIPPGLSAYETINYFVMRLVDKDYAAASVLTSINKEDLKDIQLGGTGIQTLMRCNIEKSNKKADPPSDGSSHPFRCRITTLGGEKYYHSTFIIWLSGKASQKDLTVTEIKVGSVLKLSDYEAAMQINRPEYITVFGCRASMLESFTPSYIRPFAESVPQDTPNGLLFTAYRQDNTHVDRAEYRLEDDVLGYALLSAAGELVLMSHNFTDITKLDNSVIFSAYAPYIAIKGRYRLDSSVLQTLCVATGMQFEELLEPGDEH